MTAPNKSVLRVERADGIAMITLDRPEAMNALSRDLRGAIGDAFRELRNDPEVAVAIVTGAGRAFCAGVDLKELAAGEPAEAPGDGDVVQAMGDFHGPIIGAINGFAITGGFELALACDVLIASTEARFADTHARVGILPGWGLSQKLPRLIGISRAKELAFTGNYIDAEEACAWGLVNRVVEPDALLPTCRALAQDMLSVDRRSLFDYKRLIDDGFATSFGEAMAHESRVSVDHAKRVKGSEIGARREAIQSRGRVQSRSGG